MFELAPVSLWLEDLSGLRSLLDAWRAQGVVDIHAFLHEDPVRVATCVSAVRVVKVNRRTLTLFEADSLEHLVENLDGVFREVMFDERVVEFTQFWNGLTQFSVPAVNYTLSGRRVDIQLSFNILPGHEQDWSRVLVATEDLSEKMAALRAQARSESYFRSLFDHAPVGFWVMDIGEIKAVLGALHTKGADDVEARIATESGLVRQCFGPSMIVDMNATAVRMFKAPDKAALMRRLPEVLGAEADAVLRRVLLEIWRGHPPACHDMVADALDGTKIVTQVQCSAFPHHGEDRSLMLLALADITARKQAEAQIEFLSRHGVGTRLWNRSFYVEEMRRLEDQKVWPMSIVVLDLNGLKAVNDHLGHQAGDALLRRCGAILDAVAERAFVAARIGGDEFVILMPFGGPEEAAALVERVRVSIEIDNRASSGVPISLAIGYATSKVGEPLDSVFSRADRAMYDCKQRYYAGTSRDRRAKTIA